MKYSQCTALLAVLLSSSSCVVGDDADATANINPFAKGVGNLYNRVVIGRLYQADNWMLPHADTYRAAEFPSYVDRRIHYACDALVRLDPTYVSGLVRLAWDTVITDEMKAVFRGVKQCVRAKLTHPVGFDVELNAKQFTEPRSMDAPDGVGSLGQGRDRLRARLNSGNRDLAPDIWFFDFYTVPFNKTSENWYVGAMRDGINWIHADKKLVGGNVWGKSVPPGTDFAAIPLTGGFPDSLDQINALESVVPTFVHIRNDPQVCDSDGLEWFTWHPDRRADAIDTAASKQAELNVGYMFPLFFPLSATGPCKKPGETQVAYDAVDDGLIGRMRDAMDRYQYRPR